MLISQGFATQHEFVRSLRYGNHAHQTNLTEDTYRYTYYGQNKRKFVIPFDAMPLLLNEG